MTTTPAWAVMFSPDQCRVLRQVRAHAPECGGFANERSLAANFSTRSRPPGAVGSAPGTSAPGRPSQGAPSSGLSGSSAADTGGSAPGSTTPGSGASAPGGTPGNPGGGAPNDALRPIQPPPQKPSISLAALAKLRGEIRDAARQRAIDRIISGQKPPDTDDGGKPSRPGIGKPDFGQGPGGLRGASSKPASSGGIRR
jgi:hypothetical protein